MSMMESVAYLKGLAKGLDVSSDTKEGKLIIAIIDVLDEMASSVADVEEICEELDELVGIIDEDLGNVEEDLYSMHGNSATGGSLLYEVTCPKCGEQLEFDLNDIDGLSDDECECGCGCGVECDCGCREGQECTCGHDCSCNSVEELDD